MGRIETGVRRLATRVVMMLTVGCSGGITLAGDGDHDTDAPLEAEADAADAVDAVPDGAVDYALDLTDVDVSSVEDADGAPDADGATCPGWYDPTSGLCWQDPPDETERTWDEAVEYCDALALGEHDDWRLPTISELRSIILGCVATQTAGPCGVTDTCLGDTCASASCDGCAFGFGPGHERGYWPRTLHGPAYYYWSSSASTGGGTMVWTVDFSTARVVKIVVWFTPLARCVRPGP